MTYLRDSEPVKIHFYTTCHTMRQHHLCPTGYQQDSEIIENYSNMHLCCTIWVYLFSKYVLFEFIPKSAFLNFSNAGTELPLSVLLYYRVVRFHIKDTPGKETLTNTVLRT